MIKTIIGGIISLLALNGCSGVGALKIKSFAPTPEKGVMISGTVSKPEGEGPFPGIIILHGCAGIQNNDHDWARRFNSWGYASLILSSHSPRRISDNCSSRKVLPLERALDAHAAKVQFGELPYVDRDRIGVFGYSEGGISTIEAVNFSLVEYSLPPGARDPFSAAVALYPYCRASIDSNTNLLILIGEKDDWTPAVTCEMNLPKAHFPGDEIALKVYPGAYHKFDERKPDRLSNGHRLEYSSSAMADAVPRVKAFLDKYLKN